MVAHTRTSVRADGLRALNRPRPCQVATERGIPVAIIEGVRQLPWSACRIVGN